MTKVGANADELNEILSAAQDKLRSLRCSASASLHMNEPDVVEGTLYWRKFENEWLIGFQRDGDESIVPIHKTSLAIRVATVFYLQGLEEALMEAERRLEARLVQAIAVGKEWLGR